MITRYRVRRRVIEICKFGKKYTEYEWKSFLQKLDEEGHELQWK